jgi:hypothetical protein
MPTYSILNRSTGRVSVSKMSSKSLSLFLQYNPQCHPLNTSSVSSLSEVPGGGVTTTDTVIRDTVKPQPKLSSRRTAIGASVKLVSPNGHTVTGKIVDFNGPLGTLVVRESKIIGFTEVFNDFNVGVEDVEVLKYRVQGGKKDWEVGDAGKEGMEREEEKRGGEREEEEEVRVENS